MAKGVTMEEVLEAVAVALRPVWETLPEATLQVDTLPGGKLSVALVVPVVPVGVAEVQRAVQAVLATLPEATLERAEARVSPMLEATLPAKPARAQTGRSTTASPYDLSSQGKRRRR